ncbi:MAG: hypothetical protein IR160_11360 [Salinibacterium sp.]|nr:hypothetical protein [Salinibacterium sp.]MBF0673169.1 hypothetical protein [Salinibacterium sp.]
MPGARTTHAEWDVDPRPVTPSDDAQGDWYAVRGTTDRTRAAGDLLVRVGESTDGRLILTGLRIVGEREITANTLRAIQPAKIVQTIAWRETSGKPPRAVGDVDPLTALARFEGVAMEFEAIAADAPVTGGESKRGRRGPSRDDLEQFADVYLGFYRAGKADPVKQTTRALNISRATAHRRITQARKLGFIPPREEEK